MKLSNFVAAFLTLSVLVIIHARPALAQDSSTPDLSGNDPHWIKDDSQCWMWDQNPIKGESVTWTDNQTGYAHCAGQPASSLDGLEMWRDANGYMKLNIEGLFSNGMAQGTADNPVTIDFYSQGFDLLTYKGGASNGLLNGDGTVTVHNSDGTTSSYEGNWNNGVLIKVVSGAAPADLASQTLSGVQAPPSPGPQTSEVAQNTSQPPEVEGDLQDRASPAPQSSQVAPSSSDADAIWKAASEDEGYNGNIYGLLPHCYNH